MPEVDLFAEDRAHELFVSALVKRLATEAELEPLINVRSAIGGHGRAIRELKLYQRAVQQGIAGLSAPDLLIVVIDANCAGVSEARGAIEKELQTEAAGEAVVACPDPHIERWFFADPGAFATIIGTDRQPGRRKCIRDEYKRMLREAVAEAGHFPALGGLEFATDLVEGMDLYRASQREPSLGHLIRGVRAFFARAHRR